MSLPRPDARAAVRSPAPAEGRVVRPRAANPMDREPSPMDIIATLPQAFLDAPVGLAVLDADGVEWAANARWEEILGGRHTEGARLPWTIRLPEGARASAAEAVTSALRHPDHAPVGVPIGLPVAGRGERSVRIEVRALGAPGLCVASAEEVPEPDEERQLQLRLALDTADLAAWSLDVETMEERWFAGSEELFGLCPGPGTPGERVLAAIAPEHRQQVDEAFHRALDGSQGLDVRFRMRDRSGAERWMWDRGGVHLLGDPPRKTMIGVTRDITAAMHRQGRLEERAEAEAERADRIQEVAAALLSATTTDEVARTIADHFCAGTDAIGSLVLVPEDGRMRTMAGAGTGVRMGRLMDGMRLDPGVLPARVMREGRAFYARSRAELRELTGGDPHDLLSLTPARSWAMLPLARGDHDPGALVFGFARRHDFPVEERTLLLALSGLTSQAMERCSLVQARIDLARAVQRVLLPGELPRLPGLRLAARYAPARDGVTVGGDWYDALRLPDGRCGLCIGDVEGHDVEAAATMGQVRTAMRAHAQNGADPGQVLSATNALLCSLHSTLFATCTYVVLDLERGELAAATAGHVPGLLGLSDGGTRLLTPPPGPPLGVLPSAAYPCVREPLAGVRWCALLTDGLLEGPEVELEAGLDRVRAALGREDGGDCERLADTALMASGPTGHLDDAAVLAACL